MDSLRNSFDDAHDDFPPPGPIARPMEARDAWNMAAMIQRQIPSGLSGEDFVRVKKSLENLISHILVDVQPGGKISGFSVSGTQPGIFANPHGIIAAFLSHEFPRFDQADAAKRLLRGTARQAMANGQNSLEVFISDDNPVLRAICHDYTGSRTGRLMLNNTYGPVSGDIYTIPDLTRHFGYHPRRKDLAP